MCGEEKSEQDSSQKSFYEHVVELIEVRKNYLTECHRRLYEAHKVVNADTGETLYHLDANDLQYAQSLNFARYMLKDLLDRVRSAGERQ